MSPLEQQNPDKTGINGDENPKNIPAKSRNVAVLAQALYLANITVLPILAFIILIFVYIQRERSLHPVAETHLKQSFIANIVSGVLLILVSLIILGFGSFDSPYTWMILLVYFISIHSMLILFGVFALIKAMAGVEYRYPLIGKLWL